MTIAFFNIMQIVGISTSEPNYASRGTDFFTINHNSIQLRYFGINGQNDVFYHSYF